MKHLLVFFSMMPLLAVCQSYKGPFIANSYVQFIHPEHDKDILDVFTNATDKVVVKTAQGKRKYPIAAVWGFTGKDQVAYRVYEDKPYTIRQADTLSIYERHKTMYKARKRQYYFSVGLNGAIHELRERELKTVFGSTNREFLSALKHDLKWHEDYEAFDKKDKTYKIVGIYKKSIQNQ